MEIEEKEILFHSTTHGDIPLLQVLDELRIFLEENPKAKYSLVIATDSHEKFETKNTKSINLVTAIVVYRKGFGGKYFWRRKKPTGRRREWRVRWPKMLRR